MKSNRHRFTIQKYKCKQGHTSERVVEDAKRFKTQKCQECGKRAEHVFIVERNALPKSTIIYEKPGENGRMERLYVDPAEPSSIAFAEKEGYARREIQGIHAMRRFEKEVTREMKADYDRAMGGDAKRREEFNKRYCDSLRTLMNRSDVHPFWKEMFQAAIDERNSGYSNREPEFGFRNAAYS
jgi:hypothetical protein